MCCIYRQDKYIWERVKEIFLQTETSFKSMKKIVISFGIQYSRIINISLVPLKYLKITVNKIH